MVDSVSHGFVPLVVADACGDRDPQVHEANLADMGATYAEILTEGHALAYLSSAAVGGG